MASAKSPKTTQPQDDRNWVGGFAQSNPAFAYPNPDLSSLKMLGNMDNIDKLDRQQGVEWPEFSWESVTDPAVTSCVRAFSRCFQRFSPYISRIGYTDEGRIYSIICPQQGVWVPNFGTLNIEVTVLSQRGWVDETTRELAADMTVEGKIWFSPTARQLPLAKRLNTLCKALGLPFPDKKKRAIRVATNRYGEPQESILPVRIGASPRFTSPPFTLHPEAWSVAYVEAQIGSIIPTGIGIVDRFNQLVLEAFNAASGGILRDGNLLSWNVWFRSPGIVHRKEWRNHAKRWRKSIDVDHGSPTGPSSSVYYVNHTRFNPTEQVLEEVAARLLDPLLLDVERGLHYLEAILQKFGIAAGHDIEQQLQALAKLVEQDFELLWQFLKTEFEQDEAEVKAWIESFLKWLSSLGARATA